MNGLTRDITLHFRGDWGQSNLHRVCGWYAQELGDRCGAGSRFAIWNGRGAADNIAAVASREVDVSLVTPAAFAAMAHRGLGPYEGKAFEDLRALACLPHRDRLLFATTRPDIKEMADLATAVPTPILTAPYNNGINHVGLAVDEILGRAGAPVAEMRRLGDPLVESDHSLGWFEMVEQGRADLIAMEAIMLPAWHELAAAVPLTFLDLPEHVRAGVTEDYGWSGTRLDGGYLPGQAEEIPCLDFSDFLVITTTDLDEDLAHLIAACTWETREHLERQYRHLLPGRSPLSYPLRRTALATTPIPLHPGAAAYFEGSA